MNSQIRLTYETPSMWVPVDLDAGGARLVPNR